MAKLFFVLFCLIGASLAQYPSVDENENQIEPAFEPKPKVPRYVMPSRPAPQFKAPVNYPTYVEKAKVVQATYPAYQPQYVQQYVPQYVAQPQYVQQYVPQYVPQYVQPQYVQTQYVQPQYVPVKVVETYRPAYKPVPVQKPVREVYPVFQDPTPTPVVDEQEEDIQPAFQPAPVTIRQPIIPSYPQPTPAPVDEQEEDIQPAFQPAPEPKPVPTRRPAYPESRPPPIADEQEEDIQPAFQPAPTIKPVRPAREPEYDGYIVNYEQSKRPQVTEQEVSIQNVGKKPIDRY